MSGALIIQPRRSDFSVSSIPVLAHLIAVAALVTAATVWVSLNLPAASAAPADSGGTCRFGWINARTIALAAIIHGMALAEGSDDWLPLIVVDSFGMSATFGAIIYTFFGFSMAIGRFAGGRIIDRFGRVPVVRASALVAGVGIVIVALSPRTSLPGQSRNRAPPPHPAQR